MNATVETPRTAAIAESVKLVDKMLLLHAALADGRLAKADVTVLAILIEATNKKRGCAWASLDTIAAVANVKRRWVQRIIKKLDELHYLNIVWGGRGPKDTNRYFVNFEGRSAKPPLAIPRAATSATPKGGLQRIKGGLPSTEGRSGRPPDTSYIPTELETFRPRGVAESDAPRKESQEKEVLPEEEPNIAAKLRIIESTIKNGRLTKPQIESWSSYLEDLLDIYEAQTGDPIGGWAYRLLDELGAAA